MTDDIFPFTNAERVTMIKLGWMVVHGCEDDPRGWGWMPSSGPIEFITERAELLTRFLDDIESTRAIARADALKGRAAEMADEIMDCLGACVEFLDHQIDVNWEGDGPNRAMQIHTEAKDILEKLEAKP